MDTLPPNGTQAHAEDTEATLHQALHAAQSELEALRSELDETNRGVLALYAELEAQADELRQATELKSRFLAYMSHEFRTPIVAIQSITRLLMDRVDGPLTVEQEKQVSFIRDTAGAISAFSTFTELQTGQVTIPRLACSS